MLNDDTFMGSLLRKFKVAVVSFPRKQRINEAIAFVCLSN